MVTGLPVGADQYVAVLEAQEGEQRRRQNAFEGIAVRVVELSERHVVEQRGRFAHDAARSAATQAVLVVPGLYDMLGDPTGQAGARRLVQCLGAEGWRVGVTLWSRLNRPLP